MKAINTISTVFILLLAACNSSDKSEKSDNDMDAARNFLDAALKGNFKDASSYMLQDSANEDYLSVSERSYERMNADEKEKLKKSSLNFFNTMQMNDSTTITVFANSYKNKKDTLRIVKKNGQWLVDLKYLFEHNLDTIHYHQNSKIDTIQK